MFCALFSCDRYPIKYKFSVAVFFVAFNRKYHLDSLLGLKTIFHCYAQLLIVDRSCSIIKGTSRLQTNGFGKIYYLSDHLYKQEKEVNQGQAPGVRLHRVPPSLNKSGY